MKCPNCNGSLLQKSNDKYKMRTKILVFNDKGECLTNCRYCKSEIIIPINISKEILENIPENKITLSKSRKFAQT